MLARQSHPPVKDGFVHPRDCLDNTPPRFQTTNIPLFILIHIPDKLTAGNHPDHEYAQGLTQEQHTTR